MADIKKIKVLGETYTIVDGNAVTLNTDQTITGTKTFDAPENISGTEQATTTLKTANGGQIIFGKEGSNSGTLIGLDQEDGTRRLNFRASETAGAMVWEQPESNSYVYFDVVSANFRKTTSLSINYLKNALLLGTDSNGKVLSSTAANVVSLLGTTPVNRATADKNGNDITTTYALKSAIPTVNNGTLTIQTEGTSKGTFTANQSTNTTINIKASDLGLSGAMKFLGTTTTAISDGSKTNPITIDGASVTATSGNVVLYESKEFLWTSAAWEELGDESSHALKTVTITGTGALGGGGSLESNRTITHNTTTRTNTTSTASPAYGGTFTVIDSIESNTYGHITKVNTKTVTLPTNLVATSVTLEY